MPEHQPQLDGKFIMRQYNDLQRTIQDEFILCPVDFLSRLTGDGSNVKQEALSNATQMLEKLSAQKKTVESLLGLSPGTNNADAGTADYEIDSVSSALLKTIQIGVQQNNELFKALLPQAPPQQPNFEILGNLIIQCIEALIVLCAQVIAALER